MTPCLLNKISVFDPGETNVPESVPEIVDADKPPALTVVPPTYKLPSMSVSPETCNESNTPTLVIFG